MAEFRDGKWRDVFAPHAFDVVVRQIRSGYLIFDLDSDGEIDSDGTSFAPDGMAVTLELAKIFRQANENFGRTNDQWPEPN